MRLASAIGSCSVTRQMPVPTFSVVVLAATPASSVNGSWQRKYGSGSDPSAVPGNGVSRRTGMCTCSGTQNESNPRASTSGPNSSAGIALSVAKMKIP